MKEFRIYAQLFKKTGLRPEVKVAVEANTLVNIWYNVHNELRKA